MRRNNAFAGIAAGSGLFATAALIAALAAPNLYCQPATAPDDSLAALSLEELTQVEVTSVARKGQQLRNVAAAVYVITADEIRRSGATSVPDVLRMVPGIEVAQISSDIWAISARGFNSRSANKILVLIDGRSIYNNLYSGTFWDQNQVPLENIERIEVIRGPGATMWGANAVDGVISIITKKAKDTEGLTLSTVASQNELPDTSVRYGGHYGDTLQYRFDSTFTADMSLLAANGSPAGDRWHSGQSGARADWQITDRDTLTTDGQIYQGSGSEPVNPAFPLPSPLISVQPFDFSGGFVRSQWERRVSATSAFVLQVSFTQEARSEWIAHGVLDTADVDFQHHILIGNRNDFNWGGEYKFQDDKVIGFVQPPIFKESMISLFAQDEFFLIPSRLSLTGGIKVQDFLNTAKDSLAIQPQARLLWTPTRSSSFWAAVSRAVRTPSEVERDLYFSFPIPSQNGIPVEGLLSGNPALPGEVVIAYEAGYRRQLGKRLSLDIAAFYNHYTNLIQTINQAPYLVFAPGPEVIAPETYASTGGADTRGVELAASWSPRRNWRLQVSYAWETASFEAPVSLSLTVPPGAAWATPAQTTSVRSSWDVTRRWSVDSSVYGVSAITDQSVPGYARVDLRVARKLGEGGEFSAGAQNLFDEKHVEFRSEDYLISSYLRRNVFVKIVWRF